MKKWLNSPIEREHQTTESQPKNDNVNTNDNKRTLIKGFSNSGKTYLMIYIVFQKPETFF